MKIAIVQLASWGDVVISTCIPRAIKKQKPGWHITYYTSSVCADALKGNPDIDETIVKDVKNRAEAFDVWGYVTEDAKKAKHSKVVVPWAGVLKPQDWRLLRKHDGPNNFMWAYPRMIQSLGLNFKSPIKTTLNLEAAEIKKAADFISSLPKARMLMMEIEGKSGQTWWNDNWTTQTINMLRRTLKKFHLFISHGGPKPDAIKSACKENTPSQQVHYMDHFSIREMTALFEHCDTMFSVSSATANACMTNKRNIGKRWFELINNTCWDSQPMGSDGKHFFYQNDIKAYLSIVSKKIA